jgi:hypothetical protein
MPPLASPSTLAAAEAVAADEEMTFTMRLTMTFTGHYLARRSGTVDAPGF